MLVQLTDVLRMLLFSSEGFDKDMFGEILIAHLL
jgi:hypothetical protein